MRSNALVPLPVEDARAEEKRFRAVRVDTGSHGVPGYGGSFAGGGA